MNNELRYALYHSKKTLFRLAIMVLFCLIIVNAEIHSSYTPYNSSLPVHYFSLVMFGIDMVAMASIVPMLEFAEFKNRRNLDTWYSLPLDRWKLAVIHTLNGAIQIFVAHTISFLWGLIKVAPYVKECNLHMSVMVEMYFVILGVGLVYYGFVMFPFMVANNTFDGVMFAGFYNLIPVLLYDVVYGTLVGSHFDSIFATGPISGVAGLAEFYSDYLSVDRSGRAAPYLDTGDIIWMFIWIFIGVLFLILSIRFFNMKKTEKIGGISDSPFGYTVLIPVTMFSILLSAGGEPIIGIIYGIVTLILYVIFRRGIRLRIPDIVIIAIVTIMGNIPVQYLREVRRLIMAVSRIK